MMTPTVRWQSVRAAAAGLAVVLCGAALGCGGTDGAADVERRPPLVEAVVARAGTLPLEETVNGVVRARDQVTVRSEIAGMVVEMMVESGAAVDQGQPLVRLDDAEWQDQLRQATAGVRLAEAATGEARARVAELEARLRRTRALAADELVSAQELEVQEAQLAALAASAELAAARVEQAQATAAERRSALAKTVVRSPVTGRVGQRQAEVGMRVDPGDPLFEVGNLNQVKIEVPLTERLMDQVEAGMPVIVESQGAGEPIRAALSRVSPFLAEDSFTTAGEIDVDNRDGRLRPGNYVTVRMLHGESRRATLVPASAVWEDPDSGRRGIFVAEGAGPELLGQGAGETGGVETADAVTIVFRAIDILAEGGGTFGVDGIAEGDWVVILGQHMLAEQARDEARRQGNEAAAGPMTASARVRAATWDRVQAMQALKREDLLAGFLDKQQRVAAALGAEIPESEAAVDRVLGKGSATAGGGS